MPAVHHSQSSALFPEHISLTVLSAHYFLHAQSTSKHAPCHQTLSYNHLERGTIANAPHSLAQPVNDTPLDDTPVNWRRTPHVANSLPRSSTAVFQPCSATPA